MFARHETLQRFSIGNKSAITALCDVSTGISQDTDKKGYIPRPSTTVLVKPTPACVFLVRIQLERLHFVAAGRAFHRAENAVVLQVLFQSASWEQDLPGAAALTIVTAAPLRARDETSLAFVRLVGG